MARYKFQEFVKKQESRFLKTEVTNSNLIRISDANHYFEMYKQQLIIPVVTNQRELLLEEMDKYLMLNTNLDVKDLLDFKQRFKQ